MKRLLAPLILILAIQAWPVLAQDSPSLSKMEISLWPEFDRPDMLVIYRGVFTSDTPLPVPVEIRIPARVGRPTALAYESEGRLLNQEYVSRVEGEWRIVAFELSTLAFQLEYYDDQLSLQSGGRREFPFSYQTDYPIAALSFEAQVPPDAEAFTLEPAADLIAAGDYGLDYHTAEISDVEAGTVLAWTVTYDKASSALTQDILFPETPEPTQAQEPTPAPATEDNSSTALIFLIGFVAVVAVGAAAFWLGQRAQPLPEPPALKRPKRRGSGRGLSALGPQSPVSDGGQAVFCFRCGVELRSGSDFCHSCGSPARR